MKSNILNFSITLMTLFFFGKSVALNLAHYLYNLLRSNILPLYNLLRSNILPLLAVSGSVTYMNFQAVFIFVQEYL